MTKEDRLWAFYEWAVEHSQFMQPWDKTGKFMYKHFVSLAEYKLHRFYRRCAA